MKNRMFVWITLGLMTYAAMSRDSSLLAQAAEDKYVVNKAWAQLPPGMTWDASTSSIAADGKGNVVVMVRTAPYFRVFTRDGKFVKAWGDAGLFVLAHSIMFDREGSIWT